MFGGKNWSRRPQGGGKGNLSVEKKNACARGTARAEKKRERGLTEEKVTERVRKKKIPFLKL